MTRMRSDAMRFTACIVLGAVAFVAVPAEAGPTLDRIRDRQAITFAYRAGAAPFSFANRDRQAHGYSVELCSRVASAIQRKLGLAKLRVDWVAVDSDTRLDAVASGKVDAECGTTTISLSRMERVDFSVPIFVDGATLVVPGGSPVRRIADLAGKRVAVIKGTTTERALLGALEVADTTVTLVPVTAATAGVAALRDGRADAFASDRMVLTQLAAASGDASLRLLQDDFSFEPYAIVVPRNDPDFRLAVNRALVEAYRRGDIDPIFQRWLAPLGRPSPLLNAMFYLNALPE